MLKIQRVQSISYILHNIKYIKTILKQYILYKDYFDKNILSKQELKEYIKDLISLYRQLKEYLKNTNKIFDK